MKWRKWIADHRFNSTFTLQLESSLASQLYRSCLRMQCALIGDIHINCRWQTTGSMNSTHRFAYVEEMPSKFDLNIYLYLYVYAGGYCAYIDSLQLKDNIKHAATFNSTTTRFERGKQFAYFRSFCGISRFLYLSYVKSNLAVCIYPQ